MSTPRKVPEQAGTSTMFKFALQLVRGLELGLWGIHGGAVWTASTQHSSSARITTDPGLRASEPQPRPTRTTRVRSRKITHEIPLSRALWRDPPDGATGKSPTKPRSTMTPHSPSWTSAPNQLWRTTSPGDEDHCVAKHRAPAIPKYSIHSPLEMPAGVGQW